MIYVYLCWSQEKQKPLCKWSWVTSADLKKHKQFYQFLCILELFSRWHAHDSNDPPPGASHLQHGVPEVSEPCDPVGLVDLVMRIMYEHHWHHPKRVLPMKNHQQSYSLRRSVRNCTHVFFWVALPHVFRLIDLSQSPGGLLRSQGESCCKMMTSGRSGTLLSWAWKAAEAGVWWWQGERFRAWVKLGRVK